MIVRTAMRLSILVLATAEPSLALGPSVPNRVRPTDAAAIARPVEPIAIAVEDGSAPWSRPDGTGYANEIVAAAFGALGIPIAQHVVPYARCRALVMEGSVVACYSMSKAPDLQGLVAFPAMPLFRCTTELVQNPARPVSATASISALRDLPRGTSVGVVNGYEYPPEVEVARQRGAIVLKSVTSEELLLRLLAAGRLQTALVNLNDSKPLPFLAARAGVREPLARLARVGPLDSHLGFSVRHPRGLASLRQFEQGMATIRRNGTLARIERAWADSSRATILRAKGRQAVRAGGA
ncbi:transporter substrate-binding domain-containing protein [Gemmatimonas groenlandica]|uniref:Transporter substrate-binding domain-containing protein n=1 Tax=Gemmatimonas groenlandica TaxID=2732249 RepID=A0A6M4IT78_9BACT|nr:transporter substrate-binding domain-containing protein [Gemmatimonas groenlandica]QJR36737.1 transporter substrate-binding domain-containing protein [Gemmatimonas groenlandica]